MAQQTINIGASPNDGTGTPLRTAFQYTNSNFSELYTAVGPSGNNIVVPGNATITGDLTVDTSTLKVDSANNRVGINNASPTVALDVVGSGLISTGLVVGTSATNNAVDIVGPSSGSNAGCQLAFKNGATTNAAIGTYSRVIGGAYNESLAFYSNSKDFVFYTGSERYRIASDGVATWSNVGGVAGTAMTLNATGLGVGVTPLGRLHVRQTGSGIQDVGLLENAQAAAADVGPRLGLLGVGSVAMATVESGWNGAANTDAYLSFRTRGSGAVTERLRIDSSGNVGIGVTPTTWAAGFKVIQASTGVAISTNAVVDRCDISANYYFNAGNKFLNATGRASNFSQDGGAFYFYQSTGTSGGVGSAITWGPGMTLDASGNLLVGTTSQNGSWNTKLTLSNDSGTTKWAVGPYLGGVTNFLISAGASAGVYLNGTAATSWTSASDERLKDIIEPISNAVSKVASLRAVIGKFKFDENNTRKPFLIAQDIQAVLPEAVDASNTEQLGVAYTDVIPLLVAAIKELTARVQTLETR